METESNTNGQSISTHKGFVFVVGLSVLSLYLLWAAYGHAPLGFGSDGEPAAGDTVQEHGEPGMGDAMPAMKMDMPAMGGMTGMGGGMSAAEFQRRTAAFVTINTLPDGSVRPTRQGMAKLKAMMGEAEEAEHAHPGGMPEMVMEKPGAGEEAEHAHPGDMPGMVMEKPDAGEEAHDEEPIEVYIAASRWSYEPAELTLETGVQYKFLMMGTDTSHGASINLGSASRMIRLRANALSENVITFTQPGEYFFYCTVYCGIGHDTMFGKIIVE
ncbi:MAG: hypothetical protein QGI42_00385 [Rhodospirillales bacterium]|jgi:heme/copper-type cytochrome/quinol oxidase subunit 2|nr:hypothetical protein [Rhodospirillales bacterium]